MALDQQGNPVQNQPHEGGTDPNAQQQATPQYVTAEQWQASQNQTNQTLAAIQQSMHMMANLVGQQQQQPQVNPNLIQQPAPAPKLPSRDEIQNAFDEGRFDEVLNQYVDYGAFRTAQAYDEKFQQMNAQLEQLTNASGQYAVNAALPKMKYYSLFANEINQAIQSIPAAQRTPETIEALHNMFAGDPANIQKVIAYEQQIQQRSPTQPQPPAQPGYGYVPPPTIPVQAPSVPTPGQYNNRQVPQGNLQNQNQQIPTAAELGGQDGEYALQMADRTSDQLAKNLGYKDWTDYMSKTVLAPEGEE